MKKPLEKKHPSRRDVLKTGAQIAAAGALAAAVGAAGRRLMAPDSVWQIDPHKCIQCGKCATHCVLKISAVKCVHTYAMCGYCKLCTGYFDPDPPALNTGAENQLCPAGAIKRTYIEDPYYEYKIDEDMCIGCGKCVKGCAMFGNGSLYLQVRHNLCKNCNDCSIANVCPADAFVRRPADKPYILKGVFKS